MNARNEEHAVVHAWWRPVCLLLECGYQVHAQTASSLQPALGATHRLRNSVTDLAGPRVCSYPSTFASLLGGVVFQERVMQPNLAGCIPLLRAGSVDAIVMDTPLMNHWRLLTGNEFTISDEISTHVVAPVFPELTLRPSQPSGRAKGISKRRGLRSALENVAHLRECMRIPDAAAAHAAALAPVRATERNSACLVRSFSSCMASCLVRSRCMPLVCEHVFNVLYKRL